MHLEEIDYDIEITFDESINRRDSDKWVDSLKDELSSMAINKVWNLIDLLKGSKASGCKWVFKTKRDSKGNIEQFKERLVAKWFTQKEGINYKETFSPISKKDSLRIIA